MLSLLDLQSVLALIINNSDINAIFALASLSKKHNMLVHTVVNSCMCNEANPLIKDYFMVAKDGQSLKYVKRQTPDIIEAAVIQDSYALEHAANQTEKICRLAVDKTGFALGFVNKRTEAVCRAACSNDIRSHVFVKNNKILKKVKIDYFQRTSQKIPKYIHNDMVKYLLHYGGE